MNYKIRNYTDADFEMVCSWWSDHQEIAPLKSMLPEESTFILEQDMKPILCVTLYLLNTKAFAMADNLVSNPSFAKTSEAVEVLNRFVEKFAKDKGIERILCMSSKKPLKNRYMQLGFKPTLDNVTSFIKELY